MPKVPKERMIITVMLKQKLKKLQIRIKQPAAVVGVLVLVALLGVGSVPQLRPAKAATIQEQINELERQNAENRRQVAGLREQATSYQNAIAQLQAQINELQGKIDANTAEQNRLQSEIQAAEAELTKQKAVLGTNIKTMYLEGKISTLEMLASSKDLSEFVDKQQYRNSVQSKIRTTLDKITQLKFELTAKKESVEKLLKEQQGQRDQLAGSRAEQANLLSYNEGQQAEFNQKTKNNQAKIADLIASQRRANFSPDGGYYFLRFPGQVQAFDPNAYPYANSGFGMSPGGCVDNDGPDAWGYCTRQCVSYAAWAVLASGRTPPMYYGNARDWVAAAYSRGVTVTRTPEPGDVAISTSGYWGHAMYVESVSGSTFTTSEYNAYLTGTLSYQTRSY